MLKFSSKNNVLFIDANWTGYFCRIGLKPSVEKENNIKPHGENGTNIHSKWKIHTLHKVNKQ